MSKSSRNRPTQRDATRGDATRRDGRTGVEHFANVSQLVVEKPDGDETKKSV